MRVAIHQPNFLPWLGFFHKMLDSDIFVLLDDALYPQSKSFCNHAGIKTGNGELALTIPTVSIGEQQPINEVLMAVHRGWQSKMLKSIRYAYSKTKYFDQLFPILNLLSSTPMPRLLDINVPLLRWIHGVLGLSPTLILSSDVAETRGLLGVEKIMGLLTSLKATEYISGTGAGSKRYIREEDFAEAGIKLTWQDFTHPTYEQQYGDFVHGLSVIDVLFNCGPDHTRSMLENA